METKQKPLTPSQRVRRANTALVARGGQRMPAGYLQPEVAQALARLVSTGYGASKKTAIDQAILDADKKVSRLGLTHSI